MTGLLKSLGQKRFWPDKLNFAKTATRHEPTSSTKPDIVVYLFSNKVGHQKVCANGDLPSASGALMSTSHRINRGQL